MIKFFKLIKNDDKGATAIEYGLIAALIAVAAITAMGNIGNTLGNTFNSISTDMASTDAGGGGTTTTGGTTTGGTTTGGTTTGG